MKYCDVSLVEQAQNACTHGRTVCEDVFVCVLFRVFWHMSVRVDGQRDLPTTRSLTTIAALAQHTYQRTVCALSHLSNARRTPWGLVCLARSGIPWLTPTPQWLSTSSPWKLPLKISEAGWTRPYCFWWRRAERELPTRIWFPERPSRRIQGSHRTGYAGQLIAYGTLAATASEELEAFKKFTKEKENREKAQIPEEAVRVALHLAACREHGLKKASFSMDPLLHADILEYLCSFDGGMEDPKANQQMLHKVLAIKDQHFGEHHPRVAYTLNNLAVAHMQLGDTRMGKELLERALKIYHDYWGGEHDVLASTMVNLGAALLHLGQYEKAKDVLERALKIQEQHHDQDHFEVAKTLTNLGCVYGRLCDYDKAKNILERVVNIKVKHYGQDSVDVATTLYNLALTHWSLGEYEKAAEMWERVLPVYEDHFGAHHDRCNDVRRAIDWATRSK